MQTLTSQPSKACYIQAKPWYRGQGKGMITMASLLFSPNVFLLRPAVLLASAVLASHGVPTKHCYLSLLW